MHLWILLIYPKDIFDFVSAYGTLILVKYIPTAGVDKYIE